MTYEWTEGDREPGRHIGFIAQEVEKVLPDLVLTDSKGYKSVAYQNVVPVLVEAVETQQKQMEALRAKRAGEIKALQTANAELKAQLDALAAVVAELKAHRNK